MRGPKPAASPLLPVVWHEAKIIADWLQEREGPKRRPEQTARVLALAVRLHLDGPLPWPTRRQVAEHTGVSLPMVDVVLNQRQARGDITISTDTCDGNNATRDSVITRKFIRPSQELIDLVRRSRT